MTYKIPPATAINATRIEPNRKANGKNNDVNDDKNVEVEAGLIISSVSAIVVKKFNAVVVVVVFAWYLENWGVVVIIVFDDVTILSYTSFILETLLLRIRGVVVVTR